MDWSIVSTAFLYLLFGFLLFRSFDTWRWARRHISEHKLKDSFKKLEDAAEAMMRAGEENERKEEHQHLMELDAKVNKLVGPERKLKIKKTKKTASRRARS